MPGPDRLPHLSEAWLTAVDEAVVAHERLRRVSADLELVIEYRVAGVPDRRWHLAIDRGDVRVRAGAADDPDVWFETDVGTAGELLNGDVDPLRAMISGDLTMGGDPRLLMDHREVLEALDEAFGAVRAITADR